ncbi:MAG TPA: lipid kinase [Alphaproteobacteria bacterium]|nr:lipid kinase [Alphaproteobacteria bacterium]
MTDRTGRRRALLVINEKSRQGQGPADAAMEVLEGGGIELRRETCLGPEELVATIRRLAADVDLVVLGGGDGTLSAAAPALAEADLPLGILPLGTANDLARTLGIPTDLKGAAQVIVDGCLRRIDLGEVNGHPFFNVASLGLSVSMTRQLTGEVKRRWGRLGYAVATFRALSRIRPFSAEIRHDGEVHRVKTVQISVGNGRHYGGGMTVEADARVDDGLLDLYSLEIDRMWKLALLYPAFRMGRHGVWREVRTIRCREVEIRTRRPRPVNTDGEITTRTPARFSVRRAAVAVLVPADVAADPPPA